MMNDLVISRCMTDQQLVSGIHTTHLHNLWYWDVGIRPQLCGGVILYLCHRYTIITLCADLCARYYKTPPTVMRRRRRGFPLVSNGFIWVLQHVLLFIHGCISLRWWSTGTSCTPPPPPTGHKPLPSGSTILQCSVGGLQRITAILW